MLELLREHDVAGRFRKERKKSAEAVVALPFWGRGAAGMLGLKAGAAVRVLCNLLQPGCNPDAIEEIRALGIKVRTHPRLHAQIYATEKFAIVGSSNVSTNRLTVEGSASKGWIEANVATDDAKMVADVNALFETIWEDPETRKMRVSDIKAAQAARKDRPPPPGGPGGRTLIAACRDRPGDFKDVHVAAYDEGLGKGGLRAMAALNGGARAPEPGLSAADFRKAWGYQYDHIPRIRG